jgi:hypothetical protein
MLNSFVFEGCDLKGPAVLVLQGSNFANSNLVGDPDALLWEIPPDRSQVIGGSWSETARSRATPF